MIVTKLPPLVHTMFNPIIVEIQLESGDTDEFYELEVQFQSEETVILKKEFMKKDINYPSVIFDLSKVIQDNISKEISGGVNFFRNENLFCIYKLFGYGFPAEGGSDEFKCVAINSVVQIGESSNVESRKGKFLTQNNKIKRYTGYEYQVYAIAAFFDSLLYGKTKVLFDGVEVYNDDYMIHFGMVVTANTSVSLYHQHPVTLTDIAGGWTEITPNEEYATSDNNYKALRLTAIAPVGSRNINIKFTAAVLFDDMYKIEIWPVAVYKRPSIVNGVNSIDVVVPLGTESIYFDIYGTDAVSGDCVVSEFSITELTDERAVDVATAPENPFYIRWINRQGGVDQWMFGYRQFATKAVTSQQSFAPSITDQQTQTPSEVYALSGLETIRVGAQGLSQTEYDVVSNLIYSPKIEWFNEESQSWIRLSVAGSNIERDNRNILSEVEFTFTLPEPQVQF